MGTGRRLDRLAHGGAHHVGSGCRTAAWKGHQEQPHACQRPRPSIVDEQAGAFHPILGRRNETTTCRAAGLLGSAMTVDVCTYCLTADDGAIHDCPSCQARHHPDCWQENGGCAVTGCAGQETPEPPAAPAAQAFPGAAQDGRSHTPTASQQAAPTGWQDQRQRQGSVAGPQQDPASSQRRTWSIPASLPTYPPGWYGDPWNPASWRWYDGQEWTGWTSQATG